jgi:hypothetical protein
MHTRTEEKTDVNYSRARFGHPAKKRASRSGCPNQEEKHESSGRRKPRIALGHTSASIMPKQYFHFITEKTRIPAAWLHAFSARADKPRPEKGQDIGQKTSIRAGCPKEVEKHESTGTSPWDRFQLHSIRHQAGQTFHTC